MRITIFLLLMSAFASAQYSHTLCSECGGPEPKECAELNVSQVPCSIDSVSFICQKEDFYEAWLFCPSCSEGYSFSRCDSSWLFGLYKTTLCVQNYSPVCGEYCDSNDNVLSRSNCTVQKVKKCCDIPTNRIEIASPKENSSFAKNQNITFTIIYGGEIKNITIDYGDKTTEWKTPNQNNLSLFTHSYQYPSIFTITAAAYSCNNCSHKFNSADSITIHVQ